MTATVYVLYNREGRVRFSLTSVVTGYMCAFKASFPVISAIRPYFGIHKDKLSYIIPETDFSDHTEDFRNAVMRFVNLAKNHGATVPNRK